MAILLRSPANKAESYAKEFSRLNVPLLVQRSGFYESIEISDLINLFHVLDNPLQDVPVLAVLHSPLAGLTVNELATIRLAAKGQFWTALVLWNDSEKRKHGRASKVEGQTIEPAPAALDTFRKVSAFLDRFTRWRRLARQTSLSRCLDAVLTDGLRHGLVQPAEARGLGQPRGGAHGIHPHHAGSGTLAGDDG